jgi:predicted nuclease of predicted toxin-antitoxin system
VKFLIDECLSPALAHVAREMGFGESMHVNWLRLRQRTDTEVLNRAIEGGYILVTNNAVDFRKRVARSEIHPGLVCLIMPDKLKGLDLQIRLFRIALDQMGAVEPINEVFELTASGIEVEIRRYRLPDYE